MSKKVAILIDGSNFYFKLKDLKLEDQLNFDFSAFCKFLAKGDQIVESKYYIGAIKTDGTDKMATMHARQQKLLIHLKKHKFKYELGYLLKSDKDNKFHEKGVDVNIAVDIVTNAYENKVDKIILISSDTDLIPAIKVAKAKKKSVQYVGFSHMPSSALIANCSNNRLLEKEDIKRFCNN